MTTHLKHITAASCLLLSTLFSILVTVHPADAAARPHKKPEAPFELTFSKQITENGDSLFSLSLTPEIQASMVFLEFIIPEENETDIISGNRSWSGPLGPGQKKSISIVFTGGGKHNIRAAGRIELKDGSRFVKSVSLTSEKQSTKSAIKKPLKFSSDNEPIIEHKLKINE